MDLRRVKLDTSKEEFSSALLNILDENIDVTITVTGDSMFPLWRHKRDTVVLTKCDKFALKKGDIALYRRENGQFVMHRIIKVNADSCNFCGDAQTQIEYNLAKDNIIAAVKAFSRKGKKYNCSNLWVRAYALLWIVLLPIRGILLKGYRVLSNHIK